MAKKKSKSTNKIISKNTSNDSMVSKIEIKKPVDQDKVSKIVGTIFILIGTILISYGIYSFVKFSKTPELDGSLESPSLSGTEVLTNKNDIIIRGVADEYDEVFVYVDNNEVARINVNKDSTFEYSYPAGTEGRYAVSVAGVKGFPKRYISMQSDMRIIEVDRTAPVLSEIKYSSEVGTNTFTVIGNVEPEAEVIVRRGTDKYVAICDGSGDFKIIGILLDEGPNVFSVEIIDKAGNIVDVEEKIKVTYSPDSNVNGDAISDYLPVADGELATAMKIIRENNLMVIFGLIALVAFMFSSGFVLVKYKGKE